MTRRGEDLRHHILWSAKVVFLEQGFERASMDEVAARAETSKRSLYAHFGSKEKLFLAVVDFVRDMYLEHLGFPGEDSEEPVEALSVFLARVYGHVLWESVVKTCRLAIAEAELLPAASRGYHDVIMGAPAERMAAYLSSDAIGMDAPQARHVAERLLTVVLLPDLLRALFAVDAPLLEQHEGGGIPDGVDYVEIREAVATELSAKLPALLESERSTAREP